MDIALAQRIARVIEKRKQERSSTGPPEDRCLAHSRVVAELPRLVSVVTNSLAELNEYIAETGLRIKVEIADELPSAEAIYTFSVVGREQEAAVLVASVDYEGTFRLILRSHDEQSVIDMTTVFAIDGSQLITALVALLEAQYH